jgi:hypothetical protein
MKFYGLDVEIRLAEDIMQRCGVFIEKYGIRENRSKFILLAVRN